jgi:hypothetical protein
MATGGPADLKMPVDRRALRRQEFFIVANGTMVPPSSAPWIRIGSESNGLLAN